MRIHGMGFFVGVIVTVVALGLQPGGPDARAQRSAAVPTGEASGSLIALSAATAERQQITVIDPLQRTMCVYHVNATSGEISLRSVRSLQWDLRMEAYNTGSPAPQELGTLFQK